MTIAEAGETIGREHQTRLNKAVKAKLAELEAKNAEERQKSLAKLEAEIEYWKGASKDEIAQIEVEAGRGHRTAQAEGRCRSRRVEGPGAR